MAADTLRTYSERWFQLHRPTVRWNTVQSYEATLRRRILPVLGETPIDELSKGQLRAWIAGLLGQKKVGTVAHALCVLNLILTAAVEDEIIPKNPASILRKSLRSALRERKTYPKEPMSQEQLRAFTYAAQADSLTYPAVLTMALTGMRLGEVLGLQWADVDFALKLVHVERQALSNGEQRAALKSAESRRTVPLVDRLANVLWRVRTEREMKAARVGLPLTPWVAFECLGVDPKVLRARRMLSTAVKDACKRAGLPPQFSCHSLRHTYGTNLMEYGAHPKLVQSLLGHSSLAQTEGYTRRARIADTSAVEKMSAALDAGEK